MAQPVSSRMTWDDVINQQPVVAVLKRMIGQGRLPHALLFHGPDGCGKRAVALALAQALQCAQPADAPCNQCIPCRKVARMLHPDVHVLFPFPTDTDPHEVAARLERLALEPYAAVDFIRRPVLDEPLRASNKQAIYSVGRVREDLLRPMNYRPLEGRFKIAIVTDADAMNVQAANALLKMLEEPPAGTLFILTTRYTEKLLPTIVSRCQRFRFDPLDHALIEQALLQREGVGSSHAGVVARMSAGSFTRALDLLESESLAASRDQVIEFFRRAYLLDAARIGEVVGWIGGLGREHVKGVLALMLGWISDLVQYRAMGESASLINVDQREAIARFCERLPSADLAAMAGVVEEAVGLVERNVRLDFLLMRLAFAFHLSMRGQPVERLYVPLSEIA